MTNISHKQLASFLSCGLFQEPTMDVESLVASLDKKTTIKLIYGETYDHYGLTIDSLKYYFTLSFLAQFLENIGFRAEAHVVIGDVASVRNPLVKDKQKLLNAATERLVQTQRIINTYSLKIRPVLMSQLFSDEVFNTNLEIVRQVSKQSKTIKSLFIGTVLKNRLAQEQTSDFLYAHEEVAVLMDYDLKIGPPREYNYDEATKLVGKKTNRSQLTSLYLLPTFPLGLAFDYFITHPEVEKYGLTPYKAGSNKLQSNRIIIGKTSALEVKTLIETSFCSEDPELPNPVLDLLIISDLAKRRLKNRVSNFLPYHRISNLKTRTLQQIEKFIFLPLSL